MSLSAFMKTSPENPPAGLPPARYKMFGRADVWSDWRRTASLVYFLSHRQLSTRYRGSVLGFWWSFINPLLMMGIYTFVLHFLFRASIPGVPYPIFFLTGILAWNCFAVGVSNAASSVQDQRHLYSKSHFPRFVLPLASVCANFINYLITFLVVMVLVVGCAWWGVLKFDPWRFVAELPLALVLLFGMTLGVGLVLSALAPFFRDLFQLLDVIMQAWFYATPVIYPMSIVHEKLADKYHGWLFDLYRLNPMVGVIRLVQSSVLGIPMNWKEVLVSVVGTALALAIGWSVFRRHSEHFLEAQ